MVRKTNFPELYNKTVLIKNKGIDKKTILNHPTFKLPSANNVKALEAIAKETLGWVKKLSKAYEDRAKILQAKLTLAKQHKKDKSRIKEVPNNYLLDQKLKVICYELKAAMELFDTLNDLIKRATGKPYLTPPSEAFHEPIAINDNTKPLETNK